MSVNQDVEVRAIDIIRSNVCGSRTAALAVADTARYPTNANLFPKTKANQKNCRDDMTTDARRTVFPVFMSRWKGKSDAKEGSVVAAITLESIGHEYPGRLMGTIPS